MEIWREIPEPGFPVAADLNRGKNIRFGFRLLLTPLLSLSQSRDWGELREQLRRLNPSGRCTWLSISLPGAPRALFSLGGSWWELDMGSITWSAKHSPG